MEKSKTNTKHGNFYKILTIFLGCFAILLGAIDIWLLTDKLSNNSRENAEANTSTKSKVDTAEILGSIKNAVSKIDLKPNLQWNLESQNTPDSFSGLVEEGIYYDVSGIGTAFYIPGFYLNIQIDGFDNLENEKTEDEIEALATDYQQKIFDTAKLYLTEANFSMTGGFGTTQFAYDPYVYYVNESKETVCAIGLGSYQDNIGFVACADIDNISESDKKLATELAEAIRKETGEYPDVLNVSNAKIIEADECKPYQYIDDVYATGDYESIGVSGSLGDDFYRTGTESSWALLPDDPPSKHSKDDDATKAYACWSELGL